MDALFDQEAPGLAKKLRSLSDVARKSVLSKACLAASQCVPDLRASTADLLNILKVRGALSGDEALRALSLGEAADTEYLELQARNFDRAKALMVFSEARLLTAMGTAFKGTSENDCVDAAYEICRACDDPSRIMATIESAIDSLTRH